MPFCPNCGNRLQESDKFCPECGNAVAAAAEAAAESDFETAEKTEACDEAPAAPAVPLVKPEQPAAGDASSGSVNKSLVKKIFFISGFVVFAMLVVGGILTAIAAANGPRTTFPEDPYVSLSDSNDEDAWDEYFDSEEDYDDYFDGTDFDDTYYYGAFLSAEIPDDWRGHYAAEETGDSVIFYNTDNRDAGFGGTLVTVARYTDDSYKSLPSYSVIYNGKAYTYVAIFPTDVQYNGDDTALKHRYLDMYDEVRDDLLEDMRFTE